MAKSGSNTNWATAELDPQAIEGTDKGLGTPLDIHTHGEMSGYSGDLNDLQVAIMNSQEAANHTPGDHPDRADRLESLAAAFNSRYLRLGDLIDLEAALLSLQEAADLIPADHPARARHLASLAASLDSRYQRLGDLKDLEAALQRAQEAASLTPADHPDLALHLQGLAALFDSRYRRLGDLKDLEAALQKAQEVADLTPADHPERARRLTSLAASLDSRYQILGDPKDLQAALKMRQEVVDLTAADHPDLAEHLQVLAGSFTNQHHSSGDPQDSAGVHQNYAASFRHSVNPESSRDANLQWASALQWTSFAKADDPSYVPAAYSAAFTLLPEILWVGNIIDVHHDAILRLDIDTVTSSTTRACIKLDHLTSAVEMLEQGIAATFQQMLQLKPDINRSLAAAFNSRYHRLGEFIDLEAALRSRQEAADLTAMDHPSRASHLASLAASFDVQYQSLRDLKDLRAVVQRRQEVVPADHPDSAGSFISQHHSSGDPQDLAAVHQNYVASFRNSVNPESSRNPAPQDPSHALTAYSAAFALLPELLWVGHSIDVRHAAIRNIDTVTSSAIRACVKLNHLKSAVEMLEQGIATTFQQTLQLKPNVDRLPSDQAEQLRQLSSALYSGTAANSMHLEIQRTCLLEEIRQQPGLKDFLLPKSYSALCQASQGGPIVILNSHHEGCDGIIILNPSSEPVQVVFPGVTSNLLKSQKAILTGLLSHSNLTTGEHLVSSQIPALFTPKNTEEGFADLLKWLWTNVVDPVYQVLASYEIHDGRLWWLTTGAFTGLPVHASPPSDQFIHSYTPNLGCLLEAQNKKSREQKIAVIGVARESFPERVNEEVQKICFVLRNHDFESLQAADATTDAVKLALQDCSWVHFACHGIQDCTNPTKSHLALYEENLDLVTILRMQLSNAEFVFLPAGQTAMGDAKLVNESFHIAGGFIAAGFRSAVGTLWSINGQDGPLLGEIFYTHLFGDGRQPQASDTARALQVAVKELKARNVPYERWIPFVHMGV